VDPLRNAAQQRRSLVVASAAAGVILIVVVLVSRGSAQRPQSCRATLIPAYLPPGAIVDLVKGPLRPRLVVINPGNGPGTHALSGYREAVRAAKDAGARVLGYVPTTYGRRPAAGVLADVERYMSWYGVDGIFFDEASHSMAQLPYYDALTRRVRSSRGRFVVLNPGVVPARGYFDIADVVVTFEGLHSAYAAALAHMPDWVREQPPDRVAHLVYGASRDQAMAAVQDVREAGYLYVTSGALPDPWRTLPSYLHEEEKALETCP
jgi:hypothetical protein